VFIFSAEWGMNHQRSLFHNQFIGSESYPRSARLSQFLSAFFFVSFKPYIDDTAMSTTGGDMSPNYKDLYLHFLNNPDLENPDLKQRNTSSIVGGNALAKTVTAILDKRRYVESRRTYQVEGHTTSVVQDILLHLHEKGGHADMQSELVEVHVAKFLIRTQSKGKQPVGPEGLRLFCK
jgi:hypothetical protein